MGVLTIVVLVIHIIVSLGLVLAVLLHAGKGGGISSVLGGAGSSVFTGSYIVEKNLDRITIALASIFAVTTLLLVWLLGTK
ncbi:MAG: preprotein translocase subunit SecG [Actinobacteria bacterium]|nr:preprotein translocase subunit SecG [Actinomycetota bacterium]